MQPLGAAVLILAVANIHWGSTELTPTSANPTPPVGETAPQASQGGNADFKEGGNADFKEATEATKSQQSATKPVIVSTTTDINATPTSSNTSLKETSVRNGTEAVGQGRTASPASSNTMGQGGTEKITPVFSNTTSVPDSNSTLPLGRGSSSTTSTSGTHPGEGVTLTSRITNGNGGPTTIGIQTELTTKFTDCSKTTPQLQDDSNLSSGPTPSTFEKTRYIAPAVMVPILLVGAVSFIVWKMCQSDPPGSDQNENPKYVSKTGSVQLLSVRTTTPQADVK